MRASDFGHVISELIEQLDMQSGPVESRPANTTFTRWVKLAGGRVRGTKLEMEEGLPPPKPQFAERYGHCIYSTWLTRLRWSCYSVCSPSSP